jgi:hypothetical protein
VESSHRGLRRVAALALEVVASKSETQGHLSGCEAAIRSHLVFFSPDSRDRRVEPVRRLEGQQFIHKAGSKIPT